MKKLLLILLSGVVTCVFAETKNVTLYFKNNKTVTHTYEITDFDWVGWMYKYWDMNGSVNGQQIDQKVLANSKYEFKLSAGQFQKVIKINDTSNAFHFGSFNIGDKADAGIAMLFSGGNTDNEISWKYYGPNENKLKVRCSALNAYPNTRCDNNGGRVVWSGQSGIDLTIDSNS